MSNTLYMKCDHGDIAQYVIFSGDPKRVEEIIKHLRQVRQVSIQREFHTYTGYYEDMRVTVTSTGIGGPSAAIALEEMYDCNMKVAVRLGTVMGLQDDMLGSLMIPYGAMRCDGTADTYVARGYPAIADNELVDLMVQSARNAGIGYVNGLMASCDGFYTQMKNAGLAEKIGIDSKKTIDDLKRIGIKALDMESASMLTIARLMDVKACVVTMTTVLEGVKSALHGETRKRAENEDLARVVLDGLLAYHRKHGGGK